MATVPKKKIQSNGSDILAMTSLDNICLDGDHVTTMIASGGVVKRAYLQKATNVSSGIVFNNDTAHLSFANGGVSVYAAGSNLKDITASASLTNLTEVGAVKEFVSDYVSSAISSAGGGIQTISGVSGVEVKDGNTVGLAAYVDITDLGSATSATIVPGGAYRFNCVGTTSHYISASGNVVSANKYGRDAHLQLMVGNAAVVHFVEPLLLMDPLTPFAAHDLVIKFRDGVAQAYVEDINGGYVVDSSTGTTGGTHAGTLYYGLKTASAEFFTFDAEYTSYSTGAAVMNKNKFLHGHGKGQTVLSTTGNITGAAKALYTYNLSFGDFVCSANALVVNDCDVLPGSTLSAFQLHPFPMTCNGSMTGAVLFDSTGKGLINGSGTLTNVNFTSGSGTVEGVTLSSCTFSTSANVNFVDATFLTNTLGGTVTLTSGVVQSGATATISNGTTTLNGVFISSGGTVRVSGGGLAVETVSGNGGTIDLGGKNVGTLASGKTMIFDGVTITSGLSSGANVTGGVFTASGTVIANSCTFTNCSATYGGAVATVKGGAQVTLNNCVMSGNSTGYGTIFAQSGTLVINGGTYTGNIATNGGGCAVITNATVSASNVVISGNKASAGATAAAVNAFRINTAGGKLYLDGGCTVDLIACSAGIVTLKGSNNVTSVYGAGSVTISSGATLDLTGNTNATPINPGGGITYGANVTIINSAGTSVLLNNGTAGTCATIKNDGTITT